MTSLETSPTTAALDDALARAQGQIKNASKDSVNPHFKSKYADLASIWEACKEALVKNGIAVTQWPIASDDQKLHLITRIAHKGEWMQACIAIPMDKQNAHGVGSAITYAKRYALAAALGVADEDDDGNSAVKRKKDEWDEQIEASAPKSAPRDADGTLLSIYDAKKAAEAKKLADDMITVFNTATKDEARKVWTSNWKAPAGSRVSPLAWLETHAPDQFQRVSQAHENAVA